MYYEFRQNNSGGSFIIDDKLDVTVWIEAETSSEAEKKALSIGIYFDGIESGRDCPCCGDRWSSPWYRDPKESVEEIMKDTYRSDWTSTMKIYHAGKDDPEVVDISGLKSIWDKVEGEE